MTPVFFWTMIFSVATAVSIVLLGQRDLISGNLLDIQKIMSLFTSWKFLVSMFAAVLARVAFMMTNNALLRIPKLADASTTITTFITLFALILVVVANILFLDEKINVYQGVGAFIILLGIWLMLR